MFAVPIAIVAAVIFFLYRLVIIDLKNMENKIPSVEEKKHPAFHLFLYLVSFLSLGFVVAGVITIYFQVINKFVSEPARVSDVVSSGLLDQCALKFGISSLLVASAVYYVIIWTINSKLKKEEIRQDSAVRKFITYFALVAFSAMAIGSVVALIYNYLDGELTSKFFLKILVFFIVSVFFFGFYLWEIRRKVFSGKNFQFFYVVSILLSVSALVLGFVVVDSPRISREKKIDSELESRMRSMDSSISSFYFKEKRLPSSEKNELKTGEGIEYKISGDTEFELCGSFLQPKNEPGTFESRWNHPAGRHCFKINVLRDDSNVIYD